MRCSYLYRYFRFLILLSSLLVSHYVIHRGPGCTDHFTEVANSNAEQEKDW